MRIGVVGLGAFGRHHVRHIAGHADARLTGVCDIDGDVARAAASLYGCAAFDDPAALAPHVDAVSIAVPAVAHADVALPFLEAGIHVLVEKPIAADLDAARAMQAAAAHSGAMLQTGHVERFSPAFRGLAERTAAAERITGVRRAVWSGRSTDVDVVLDLMIHDIDHALGLARSPVVSVSASGRSVRSDHVDEAEAWLTFASGAIATLSASRVADGPRRTLQVTEKKRVLRADLAAPSLAVTDRRSGREDTVPLAPTDILGEEIAAFLASIASGAPVAVDARAALAALEIAVRVQAAIAEPDIPADRSTMPLPESASP